jgi:hypothetical protein
MRQIKIGIDQSKYFIHFRSFEISEYKNLKEFAVNNIENIKLTDETPIENVFINEKFAKTFVYIA